MTYNLNTERHVLELRAEAINLIAGKKAEREGKSDRLEIGVESATDKVAGGEDLSVGRALTEKASTASTTGSVLNTTVHGHLNANYFTDNIMLTGAMSETYAGALVTVAGMSDVMAVGGGMRVVAGADIRLSGLTGMEEKLFTLMNDGIMIDVFANAFEREFGTAIHNAVTGIISSHVEVLTATTWRPMMKTLVGLRSKNKGSAAGGDESISSPPEAPPPPAGGEDVAAAGKLLSGGGKSIKRTASSPSASILGSLNTAGDLNEVMTSAKTQIVMGPSPDTASQLSDLNSTSNANRLSITELSDQIDPLKTLPGKDDYVLPPNQSTNSSYLHRCSAEFNNNAPPDITPGNIIENNNPIDNHYQNKPLSEGLPHSASLNDLSVNRTSSEMHYVIPDPDAMNIRLSSSSDKNRPMTIFSDIDHNATSSLITNNSKPQATLNPIAEESNQPKWFSKLFSRKRKINNQLSLSTNQLSIEDKLTNSSSSRSISEGIRILPDPNNSNAIVPKMDFQSAQWFDPQKMTLKIDDVTAQEEPLYAAMKIPIADDNTSGRAASKIENPFDASADRITPTLNPINTKKTPPPRKKSSVLYENITELLVEHDQKKFQAEDMLNQHKKNRSDNSFSYKILHIFNRKTIPDPPVVYNHTKVTKNDPFEKLNTVNIHQSNQDITSADSQVDSLSSTTDGRFNSEKAVESQADTITETDNTPAFDNERFNQLIDQLKLDLEDEYSKLKYKYKDDNHYLVKRGKNEYNHKKRAIELFIKNENDIEKFKAALQQIINIPKNRMPTDEVESYNDVLKQIMATREKVITEITTNPLLKKPIQNAPLLETPVNMKKVIKKMQSYVIVEDFYSIAGKKSEQMQDINKNAMLLLRRAINDGLDPRGLIHDQIRYLKQNKENLDKINQYRIFNDILDHWMTDPNLQLTNNDLSSFRRKLISNQNRRAAESINTNRQQNKLPNWEDPVNILEDLEFFRQNDEYSRSKTTNDIDVKTRNEINDHYSYTSPLIDMSRRDDQQWFRRQQRFRRSRIKTDGIGPSEKKIQQGINEGIKKIEEAANKRMNDQNNYYKGRKKALSEAVQSVNQGFDPEDTLRIHTIDLQKSANNDSTISLAEVRGYQSIANYLSIGKTKPRNNSTNELARIRRHKQFQSLDETIVQMDQLHKNQLIQQRLNRSSKKNLEEQFKFQQQATTTFREMILDLEIDDPLRKFSEHMISKFSIGQVNSDLNLPLPKNNERIGYMTVWDSIINNMLFHQPATSKSTNYIQVVDLDKSKLLNKIDAFQLSKRNKSSTYTNKLRKIFNNIKKDIINDLDPTPYLRRELDYQHTLQVRSLMKDSRVLDKEVAVAMQIHQEALALLEQWFKDPSLKKSNVLLQDPTDISDNSIESLKILPTEHSYQNNVATSSESLTTEAIESIDQSRRQSSPSFDSTTPEPPDTPNAESQHLPNKNLTNNQPEPIIQPNKTIPDATSVAKPQSTNPVPREPIDISDIKNTPDNQELPRNNQPIELLSPASKTSGNRFAISPQTLNSAADTATSEYHKTLSSFELTNENKPYHIDLREMEFSELSDINRSSSLPSLQQSPSPRVPGKRILLGDPQTIHSPGNADSALNNRSSASDLPISGTQNRTLLNSESENTYNPTFGNHSASTASDLNNDTDQLNSFMENIPDINRARENLVNSPSVQLRKKQRSQLSQSRQPGLERNRTSLPPLSRQTPLPPLSRQTPLSQWTRQTLPSPQTHQIPSPQYFQQSSLPLQTPPIPPPRRTPPPLQISVPSTTQTFQTFPPYHGLMPSAPKLPSYQPPRTKKPILKPDKPITRKDIVHLDHNETQTGLRRKPKTHNGKNKT